MPSGAVVFQPTQMLCTWGKQEPLAPRMGQKGQAMLGPTLGAPLLHNLSFSILKHIPNPTPPFKNHNLQAGGLGAESLGKCTGSVLLSSPCFSPVYLFFFFTQPPTVIANSNIAQHHSEILSWFISSFAQQLPCRTSQSIQEAPGLWAPSEARARHKSNLKTESLISVQS